MGVLRNAHNYKIIRSSTVTKTNKVRKTNRKSENEKSDNDCIIQITDKSDIVDKNGFVRKTHCTKLNEILIKKILFTFDLVQPLR